jgi:uncharacterized oxidoreductase
MLINAERLTEFITEIFQVVGCSQAESLRIGINLVDASLTGHDSHGVIRTPRYVNWLKSGNFVADQSVETVLDSGPMLILDGNFGMGQTVGPIAVERGIVRVREQGVTVVALRHAGHLGRIGAWAEMATDAGLVSLHFVNVSGSSIVAPFGGVDRRLPTNPVAIGIPRPGLPPIIHDFATSIVAEGKCLVASKGGKPLPPGSLIGPDGQLSNDPALFYGNVDPTVSTEERTGGGALRAFGEHKGSGLSLCCELLAGALTRSGCTGPDRDRLYNGMLSIYLDTTRFDTDNGFAAEVNDYLEYFTSSLPDRPDGEVLLPGEPERRTRADREKNGVPISDDAWAAIVATGKTLGITPPAA